MKIIELKCLSSEGNVAPCLLQLLPNSRKKPFEALTYKEIGQLGSKDNGIAS